jgi:hypothetical protein
VKWILSYIEVSQREFPQLPQHLNSTPFNTDIVNSLYFIADNLK